MEQKTIGNLSGFRCRLTALSKASHLSKCLVWLNDPR